MAREKDDLRDSKHRLADAGVRRIRVNPARYAAALILASSVAGTAVAGVIEFFDEDREEWFAVTRAVMTIDFTGFPDFTILTNQYEHLGVLFLGGENIIICCDQPCFPPDGSGLDGNVAIHLLFDSPQRWIAADFPGALQFELFFEGQSIYQNGEFGGGGCGRFGGLLLTEPFDEAILIDWCDLTSVNLADLHFGYLPLGDLDGDGVVGISDFLELLGAWGPCPIPCPADVDGNDSVNIDDFLALLAAWGPNRGHPADVDGDGFVGINDFLALLAAWGFCPPPIGCLADLDCDGAVGINDLLTILANWG